MGTIIGDEKDTSVQFTVIANWSSFPSSSQPWFMNIDLTGSLFVFSEVCAIILGRIYINLLFKRENFVEKFHFFEGNSHKIYSQDNMKILNN